jgi:calcium/calmodulin-dependent protein kinase I
MYHILTAVAHLHRHGFWHRDIKPENILVMTETFNPDAVVLADFGYCQRLGCIQCCNECCGSPHYFAPELVRQVAYTEKVDIWALGITMFACLTSALPYDASDLGAMFEAILDGLPELFNNETVARTSDACREFLDALLDPDPAMRPTAEQALAHHWFAEMSAGGIGRATARVPAALPVISA